MRTAIYVRVSTLEQAEEGYSIDEQVDTLKKYCEIKKWTVFKVYADPGLSGSNINRPGLSQLVTDARYQQFDTVLVYKLDRLSRSQKDTLYLIEDVLGKNNISFVSLKENFDTSTPFGKAMIGILAVFAQLEREQIKERMTMGKIGRAKSGKAMSWRWTAFGYKYPEGGSRDTYEIEPLEADIVKRIFSDYLSGISITKIKDNLNAEGHVCKDVPWSHRTVRACLANPVYAGYTTWKDQLFDGNHEPIISKKIFEKVQEEIEIRQKQTYARFNNPRPFQTKYMLSGLMCCGICGCSFEVQLGNIRKDGSRLKKYKCNSRTKKAHNPTMRRNPNGCVSPTYDMRILEEKVLSEIEKLRLNPKKIYKLAHKNPAADISKLEKRIETLDKKLEKLVFLYLDNDMPKSTLEERKESIVDEKNSLRTQILNAENNKSEVDPETAFDDLERLTISVYKLSYEEQKNLVKKLVRKIILFPDHLDIHWSFVV